MAEVPKKLVDPNWIKTYVREVCDQERQKMEERKQQKMQELMMTEARAATAVKLFNQYGIHDQMDQVHVYPNWVVYRFPSYELQVTIINVEGCASLMKKDECVLEGTIQECIRALAALLKVPESK